MASLYEDYLKKAAIQRGDTSGQERARLVESRRRLAALAAGGVPVTQATPLAGGAMGPQPPTLQMRNAAGQMGPAAAVQSRFSQAAQLRGQGDTVPAMLSPGEAVIPAQQAAALARAGL